MSARSAAMAILVLTAAAGGAGVGTAGGDSFTPVRLTIQVSPVARRHAPLPITVNVTADAGALDTATAPLRVRVKLAGECGGTFSGTPGSVLLDRPLTPQPAYGQPYAGSARGSGRPGSYGVQTVCVFLEEQGDDRQFATGQLQIDVSRSCTLAADRYDRARRARQLAHGSLTAARRAARHACGPGVAL